jgi:hypothetical protein
MKNMTKGLVLLGALATGALADPPGIVMVGVTANFKTDSFDVYTTGVGSTVPYSSSALGVAVNPSQSPVLFTNRPNHKSLHPGSPYKKFARVRLASRSLSGYLQRTSIDPKLDFSSAALEGLQLKGNFYMCTGLKELHQAPFEGLLISTTNASCARIDPMSIESIQPYPGPYDGKTNFAGDYRLDPALVRLLDQGPPHFQCHDKGGYNIHWISYNETVGEKELQPICDRELGEAPAEGMPPIPTQEERDVLIKKGNVFYVTLGWD